MAFLDLFRARAAPAPRMACPFCPGPAAATAARPMCNVCRRHALGREAVE